MPLSISDFRVEPGSSPKLSKINPDSDAGFPGSKEDGERELLELNQRLDDLQWLLFAEGKRSVLMVLQAMDAAGKDGTIRDVFEGVNPQGIKVVSFKAPTPKELSHDFLWRVHNQVPAAGEIGVFNRSHYESVLVERVMNLTPKGVWKDRYDHINHFEKNLSDAGCVVLKFYLHISKDEQLSRLKRRIDDPKRNWKFNSSDFEHRNRWDDYMSAYEDCFAKCSTPWAPWFIIPANKKWYRNLAITKVMVDTLEKMDPKPPKATIDFTKFKIQ